MSRDIESVIDNIKSYLSSNLNTEIAALNTLKSDSVTLNTIDSSAYIFQTMNDQVANFDPFVFIGVHDIQAQPNYSRTGKIYTIKVLIIKVDDGDENNMWRKMLRYNRVLSEIFEKNYDKISKPDKFEVTSLEPIKFSLLNSSETYRGTGVLLDTSIA